MSGAAPCPSVAAPDRLVVLLLVLLMLPLPLLPPLC
jgi:hypothetical protein